MKKKGEKKFRVHWLSLPALAGAFIAFAAVSSVLAFTGHGANPLAYALYACTLYLAVRLGIGGGKALKRKAAALIGGTEFGRQLLSDYGFRAAATTYVSFTMNTAFALFKLAVGIRYRSGWLISFGVYYGILSGIRFLILKYHRSRNKRENRMLHEYRIYRITGALLFVLDLAVGAVVWLATAFGFRAEYPGYLIYAVAAYTFVKVTLSVVNLFKARRRGSPILSSIRAVGHADALTSLVSLQGAMLAAFDSGEGNFSRTINAVVGTAAVCIVMAMSIAILIRSARAIRRLKEAEHKRCKI